MKFGKVSFGKFIFGKSDFDIFSSRFRSRGGKEESFLSAAAFFSTDAASTFQD
jgi:hypothetical protein